MSSINPTYKQRMLKAAKHNPAPPKPPPPKPSPPKPPPPPQPHLQPSGFIPREFIYPSKSNVYDGLIMTSGIMLSSFLVRLIKKDMAPQFTSKSLVSLALVAILSDYLVDLGKRYQYIPYSI